MVVAIASGCAVATNNGKVWHMSLHYICIVMYSVRHFGCNYELYVQCHDMYTYVTSCLACILQVVCLITYTCLSWFTLIKILHIRI